MSSLAILPATAQTSAGSMTPIQFNDRLTAITDSLFARGQEWGRQFNDAYATKTFHNLRRYRQSLEAFVAASIVRVTSMKDVNNSTELRQAMLRFLEYERKMIDEAFKPIEKLNKRTTDDEVRALIAKLKTYSKYENAELQKVGAAQEAYAKSNGFRIMSEEESE